MAHTVVNQAEVDDHLHNLVNKSENAAYYCYNTTIIYNGCDYSGRTGNSSCDYNGNFTYTDCCTDCHPDNAADAAVHRRRYLQRYVSACGK